MEHAYEQFSVTTTPSVGAAPRREKWRNFHRHHRGEAPLLQKMAMLGVSWTT